MKLAILVPALSRPHRVRPLVESIEHTTDVDHEVVFILDPGDEAEIRACVDAGVAWMSPGGSYADKIRAGVKAEGHAEFVFFGADDLEFQPLWFEAAYARIQEGAEVVGVNDLLPRPHRPEHATHFLVTRAYAEQPCIDNSPGPLCSIYTHSFVDDEFIGTAKKRGVYAYARASRVKHLHPINGTAPDDATYQLGRAYFGRDRKLFRGRSHLWT